MKANKEIVSVVLKTGIDYDYPMDAFIGSFDHDAKSKVAINHWRRGGSTRDTFEWFNSVNAETMADAERDYRLAMDVCNDRKCFMRIQMIARVRIKVGKIWLDSRIESERYDGILDNDREGIEEAKKEARRDAADQLQEAGFPKEEVEVAVKKAEDVDWS